jgi:hypothetical protein
VATLLASARTAEIDKAIFMVCSREELQ